MSNEELRIKKSELEKAISRQDTPIGMVKVYKRELIRIKKLLYGHK